jgi:predicted HAD superfamily Cof-like phosphohydrolase
MHKTQKDLQDFHRDVMNDEIDLTPALRDVMLRADLIMEEACETVEAATGNKVDWFFIGNEPTAKPDFAKAIDGLCDLLYVTYGAAVRWGIDLEPFWDAVHASNMEKANGPMRSDGKRLKPEEWTPPDISGILEKLMA